MLQFRAESFSLTNTPNLWSQKSEPSSTGDCCGYWTLAVSARERVLPAAINITITTGFVIALLNLKRGRL